ncbi:MAG TPA: PH domain-containing protein [Nitrospiraceae bacterium]|nr:PH domain-containing protein [Nitrospiraceae bacterium]
MDPLPPHERVFWQGHPSWADHAVLFVFMAAAGVRAILAFRTGEWTTALLYVLAIGVFFGIAAAFHYGVFYQISSQRIRIASGFRTSRIREIMLDQIESITVKRELLNRWFDLGSLHVVPRDGREGTDQSLVLKGVPDPDAIQRHIERMAGWSRPSRGASFPT